MNPRSSALALALLAALAAGPAAAETEVVIGVLYPMSCPVAQGGLDPVAGVKAAVEIINNGAKLPLPLAKGGGLPNLGGAKIRVVIADHQGKPATGQAEAER